MGLFSKDIRTMDDLFAHTLRDVYYAEQEILKALPTMIEKATNPQLRSGLEQILRKAAITLSASSRCFRCTASNARRLILPPSMGS